MEKFNLLCLLFGKYFLVGMANGIILYFLLSFYRLFPNPMNLFNKEHTSTKVRLKRSSLDRSSTTPPSIKIKKPKVKQFWVHNGTTDKTPGSSQESKNSSDMGGSYEYRESLKCKAGDFGSDLIDISALEEKVKKQEVITPQPYTIIPDVTEEDNHNDFAVHIQGNVLQAMEDHKLEEVEATKEKYKKLPIPPVIKSKAELYRRAEKHMEIVPRILNGKESTLDYYELARTQQRNSAHAIMSSDEKWSIDWEKYHGGYFGFKRQLIVGNVISKKYEDILLEKAKKNKVVLYWTISGFSTFVLANEILIRMAMEDMGWDFEKTHEFMRNLTDYGRILADSVEIKDDLEDAHNERLERANDVLREIEADCTDSD